MFSHEWYRDFNKERAGSMTDVADEIKPKRDAVADWRMSECIRIVGLDHAHDFAVSKVDLHLLERMARSGATSAQLADWLL